jgi:hypothetical protein
MKVKLLFLFLIMWVNTYAQKLPINGLCWSDIKAAVGGSCLDEAFANANPAWFDTTYSESGNCLMEFRNYGAPPCTRPSGLTACSLWYEMQSGYSVTCDNVCTAVTLSAVYGLDAQGALTEGSDIYFNSHSDDCTKIDDGCYVLTIGLGPKYPVQVSGGKLYYLSCSSVATVTTNSIINIAYTTASSGGNVTADGGATVTERGIVIGTSSDPTIASYIQKISSGTGTGSYSIDITGLSVGTTYHVRAYAINSAGTSYGSDVSFSTASITVPTVSTTTAYFIDFDAAYFEGTVNDDGGASVTERGFCWSTSPNPTIFDNTSSNGTGTGSFNHTAYALEQNTTYYIRAYATNSQGTAYGAELSVTQPEECTTRPVGLTHYVFMNATRLGSVWTDVTSSNICTINLNDEGTGYQGESSGAGTAVYLGLTETDCSKVPDGYYLVTQFFILRARIHIINGIWHDECP